MTGLHFIVNGHPATQGSKRHVGKGRMVEMDKKLPVWRAAIVKAAQEAAGPAWEPLDGPLCCILDVYLPEPAKTKFRDGPAGPPDTDKLQRAVGDALTIAGIITDDARITRWVAEKHWAPDLPGAHINIFQRRA